ncbi:serine hydrolase domain-containing protein [Acinetobacter venetianus]|uniref:serine hydrolase domain-containing protein n=1 Tax=Acinetobacter venetianus TaxID=52133 RepID=UPI00241D9C2C|nr:serine hydrolase domain-containing protein [Acinetobacter venetianus]
MLQKTLNPFKYEKGRVRFGDIIIVVFIILIIALITHFTLIDRVGFWRLIYPLQAQFSKWSINCSKDSPNWMRQSLKYIIKNQKTLSNQLAYIDQNNQTYTCQSGWVGHSIISKKLSIDTRFRYASMTKVVTNDAVIQLINSGKIKLTDPMYIFFNELKDKSFKDIRIKKITISDLLQQRSGFDRMRSEDVVFATDKTPWCPTQLTKLLELKLDFEPNLHYAYDNRNTCLLGAVIERVTGEKYRDYIEENYHLALNNMKFIDGFYYPDEVRYDFRNNDFWMEKDDNSFNFKTVSSSAGLSGSAQSFAKLIKSMLEQRPLNILSIAQKNLETCKVSQFKSCNGYAMLHYRKNKAAPLMYFRDGGLPAVTSLTVVTDKNEVIVWIGNGATLYDDSYRENFLEHYFYETLHH